ncbi:major facilitator superfamily domain-containing protein [Dactylonectria estremocensis]|uniref:Major facilitator superfamily domain-containing protein n=1 Tax=Dactylonectria estremocensis TaxID=1079267 RepID=A0A9P9DTU7_9HYPO|nr:major facilitator superfamily domain-containing protein [Dactylonectria estremocensis]
MILVDDIESGDTYGRLGTASTSAAPLPEPERKDRSLDDDQHLEGSVTSVELEAAAAPQDPNIVDWDGPNDPANPHNWSRARKGGTIALVSAITFVTPLASSIFSPSIDQVMTEFNSTNQQLASFIVSVYLLGYCFGPLVVAPLSEVYGKNPLYNVCNVMFVIWNVACAKAPNISALIIFRFFAGLAGCCPVTLGAGSLTDITSPEHRVAALSGWIMGPLLGPVVGPIAGGYLTEAKDWRWSFWVVSMVGGVIVIVGFLFMRETDAKALLEQKTKRLRKETSNPKLTSKLDPGLTIKELFRVATIRPGKMLLFSPIILCLSLYMAIVYGYLYLLFTALPMVFKSQYGFTTGQVGLSYIGFGIGSTTALGIIGGTSDRITQQLTKKNGGEAKPEYRLPVMALGSVLVPVGLFMFGWTVESHNHWILPIIGTSFVGLGMVTAFMSISVYLVDAYTAHAVSAIAASTVFRSLLGALLPLAGRKMFHALGLGWGSSLLAFIAVVMIPISGLLMKYGENIRHYTIFNMKVD